MPAPRVIGHRGAARAAPENTLAGLRAAKALGAAWVEVDVRLTRDGRVILLHDARIDRTTDGRGAAAALTLAEIEECDAGGWFATAFRGERVPTLEAAVALLGALGLGAVFEMKATPAQGNAAATATVGVLTQCWPAQLPPPVVSSFDAALLVAARRAAPGVERALAFGAVPDDWHARADAVGAATLHVDHRALDAATAATISVRLPVFAYTVNQPERARTLFGWGVAGVFTDCPDLINAAIGGT
jgi:glycerophosphoryl diester phosphodiesterase